ncbi:type II toxin-antitoxin system death-on-curing family toxin [Luteolibacter sp. LG18]|uniref:type II toxin-antitoxin system death-on-curing family toxin n=1 Tax=Luteolibacter sp. LG18 TaxID=2819286 RepID=UPI002B28C03F|nr:death-on-curing protein [Luteolibacter sp. LG18]
MNSNADQCFHLPVEVILEIHHEAITQFGGATGIRDIALLESAAAAPQAGFGGKSVYEDTVDVAGAYLFYLCRNHPFIDGNKRVALGSCIVFLRINGYTTSGDGQEWEDLTMSVAAGEIDRIAATQKLRNLLSEEPG